MLRCKTSYVDICPVTSVKLVGNSLAAWPSSLQNCQRVPHPQRESKPFLRDKILCKDSGGHIGNIQNNLTIGAYTGKLVALFRASETVLDCGGGVIIDFPSWNALREMLGVKGAEVDLSADALLRLSGEAEDELAAGLAEEESVKVEVPNPIRAAPQPPPSAPRAPARTAVKREVTPGKSAGTSPRPPQKKTKAEVARPPKPEKGPCLQDWLQGTDLEEYPNAIRLVSSDDSDSYADLMEEVSTAAFVAYDCQWSPDFDEDTDNPVALLQLSFPSSSNTYVLQLPMLGDGSIPEQVRALFEDPNIVTVGFAANEIDRHKLEISGVKVDTSTLVDVQPWCEAEMGENESVRQGWRVGLKRGCACVLDFEMDKTCTIASSNWERDELTTAQVEYAAMDVWVALRIFQRLAAVYVP